ncbi:hypothetical protein LguiA_022543 [Lonicera macranthoides]
MVTSKETITLTDFTYQEQYKYWPEFQAFVIGNGIAGIYSFLILLLPPGSELWRLVVFLDVVITALLIAVFSVTMSNLNRMKNGNAIAGWVPICPRVPHFCHHVLGAVIANIVGSVCSRLDMASSGSSARHNSDSKAFDFGTDDILCSYEDYATQDNSNGTQSDPAKELHKSRLVERTVKKHTDNLMRFLEGISSRLSQLELYCYNLDKSIGEMRSDLVRDHEEADSKLKSLDKHIQEAVSVNFDGVHRSVQILRDKQELAETQKELAKLQLAQKESSSSTTPTHQSEGRTTPPLSSGHKNTENAPDMHGQQLALALPHQVPPQPSLPSRPIEQQQVGPPPSMPQSQAYYLPNLPTPSLQSQGQYLPSDSPYRNPPQPIQSQVNQTAQIHPLPQYQQQWAQQVQPPQQQQQQQQQQTSMQPQIRPSSNTLYPPYLPSQPTNPTPPEQLPNSMPVQMQFAGHSQTGSTRPEMPYGYGGAGRTGQPQPQPQAAPQQLKPGYGSQPAEGYPTLSSGNPYMMYESEGGRAQHLPQQPHFPPGGPYPPNPQVGSSGNMMARPPQFPRNHPYNELIEKLVSMGFRGDHVVGVIQRLEESGQPVDFNSVLDRLNGHSSGGPQRGWSG